eukprot:9623696-Alexandrium_andersonii.AAC.1
MREHRAPPGAPPRTPRQGSSEALAQPSHRGSDGQQPSTIGILKRSQGRLGGRISGELGSPGRGLPF